MRLREEKGAGVWSRLFFFKFKIPGSQTQLCALQSLLQWLFSGQMLESQGSSRLQPSSTWIFKPWAMFTLATLVEVSPMRTPWSTATIQTPVQETNRRETAWQARATFNTPTPTCMQPTNPLLTRFPSPGSPPTWSVCSFRPGKSLPISTDFCLKTQKYSFFIDPVHLTSFATKLGRVLRSLRRLGDYFVERVCRMSLKSKRQGCAASADVRTAANDLGQSGDALVKVVPQLVAKSRSTIILNVE